MSVSRVNRSRLISQQASLELVLRYWKDDWMKVKNQTKQHHENIENLRSQSTESQKELRGMTKELNKTINANQLVNGKEHVSPVIKKFIAVNVETRQRLQEFETAFDFMFEALEQVHEPVLALEHALADLETTKSIEKDLSDTKISLAEYEEEFKTLKNQDYTVKVLQDENKSLLQSIDSRVNEGVEKIKAQIQAENEEIIMKFKERENDTLAQLQMAKNELAEVQVQYETAQRKLLDFSMDSARSEALEDSQHQMLLEEVERRDNDIQLLKRDKEELKKQLEILYASGGGEDRSDLEDEISALRENLSSLEQQSQVEKEESEDKIAELEKTAQTNNQKMSEYENTIATLNTQIEGLPTRESYEKLRKTLSIIQEVEFNAVGDDSVDQNWQSDFTDAEALLLKKSRKLESDLTKTKWELTKMSEELKESIESVAEKEETIREQQELITKLEDDLTETAARAVHSPKSSSSKQQSSISSSSNEQQMMSPDSKPSLSSSTSSISAKRSDTQESDLAALMNAVEFEKGDSPKSQSSSGALNHEHFSHNLAFSPEKTDQNNESLTNAFSEPNSTDQSTLTIVCGQRDRFKRRVQKLEQENQKLRGRADRAMTDVSMVRQDNVKLYQKLKFVESYKRQPISSHNSTSELRNRGDIESGMDDVERKYNQLYEEQLNPFAQFNHMEVQKRYKNLNSAEKITLTASHFFLRQKSLRIFVFLYALALHFLVFFTLYTHTISPHCRSDMDDAL